MTRQEIAELVIKRWRDNLTIGQIKTVLVGRDIHLTRFEIALCIKEYVDVLDGPRCNKPCEPGFDLQKLKNAE